MSKKETIKQLIELNFESSSIEEDKEIVSAVLNGNKEYNLKGFILDATIQHLKLLGFNMEEIYKFMCLVVDETKLIKPE